MIIALPWSDIAAIFTVVLIDVALAGDNALVVGMVAAGLAPSQRRRAIFLGVAGAALLRMVFAGIAVHLLQIVGMTIAGGLLLLWVTWKLWGEIRGSNDKEILTTDGLTATRPIKTLPQAILQILLADLSMSLDNVLAVAGAARDNIWVLLMGLAFSVVLMAFAASLVAHVIHRHHWIAYVGLMVVLYVALSMIWEGSHDAIRAFEQ
ncbi:TerC family protein [Telmatospirillum sp.]|uniref:TerC family protein n=1 Tax=Telmatospirillum sp. TaxID=2079197 RepID=UPI002841F80D|nr:TerC family protein [Telmatospirillum sp.]MDR3436905.1 TerC family protein [Telmatospirillum sp.]